MLRNLYKAIKTVVMVSVIAVLIWLYAEGENVKPREVTFDVQFVSPQGVDLMIQPAQPTRVRMTFRCANTQFTEVQRLVAKPMSIAVDDPGAAVSQSQTIVIKEWLTNRSPIAHAGVTIDEVQQPTVQVQVERMATVTLPIEPSPTVPQGVELLAASTVAPDKAQVRVPASLQNAIQQLSLQATLDAAAIEKLEPNIPHTAVSPLTLPPAYRIYNASIRPATAKLTFTVRRQIESVALKTVPVMILAMPSELARQSVIIDEDNRALRDVTVTGPSAVIDRISKNPSLVWAELRLSPDELAQALGKEVNRKSPTLSGPPEVTFSPPPPVTFRVVLNRKDEPAARPLTSP